MLVQVQGWFRTANGASETNTLFWLVSGQRAVSLGGPPAGQATGRQAIDDKLSIKGAHPRPRWRR